MAYIISNPAILRVLLEPICGFATLRSKDCHDVAVPLVPLLGASSLVRSVVAESHLHPAVHGGLILNIEVAADVLVSVGELLATGEANVKEGNIEGIRQVLYMLGVEVNLSCNRISAVKLEIKFDENVGSNSSDKNEDNYKMGREELEDCPVELDTTNSCEYAADYENDSMKDCDTHVEKPGNKCNKNKKQEKKYKCKVCPYSGSQKHHLTDHMRTHTGEKPYTCSICNLSFNVKSNLNFHIKRHTGEKSYKCKLCKYSAVTCYEVRRHEKRKHNR